MSSRVIINKKKVQIYHIKINFTDLTLIMNSRDLPLILNSGELSLTKKNRGLSFIINS